MREIHYRYAIVIISALLVGSLTVKWYDIKNLSELVSFGLALSSLILAVVAIFQAIISGASFNHIIGSIANSVDQVRSAAGQIHQASAQLLQQSAVIPSALGEVSDRIDRLLNTPSAVTASETASDAAAATSVDVSVPGEHESYTGALLRRTTNGGRLVYYLCVMSAEKKVLINLEDMFPRSPMRVRYFEGFIAALRSTDIIQVHAARNGFRVDDLKNVDKIVKDYFEKQLIQPPPSRRVFYSSALESIERYFAETPQLSTSVESEGKEE